MARCENRAHDMWGHLYICSLMPGHDGPHHDEVIRQGIGVVDEEGRSIKIHTTATWEEVEPVKVVEKIDEKRKPAYETCNCVGCM